jgi:Tfp pilus assembly protein PilE
MSPRRSTGARAFTIVELLIVVATLAILAGMLLPVLSKAKARAQRARCENNLKQLNLSWIMYYQENNGHLTESYGSANPYSWVLGDMKNSADAVNLDMLRQGKLYQYNHDASIYHCPTDSGSVISGKKVSTVRSYSMNGFMGARDPQLGPIPSTATNYVRCFEKDTDLKRPSELWVFVDEDERSIDDGFFVIDPAARQWYDFPANSAHRHVYSYCLAFADGHCDFWHIRDPDAREVSLSQSDSTHSVDLDRLASAATVPK